MDTDQTISRVVADIRACGYFPDLVVDSLLRSVGDEPVAHHLVHHETTFNHDEIQRHLTVLALTPTRLLIGHTDETPSEEGPIPTTRAASTSESIALGTITAAALTRVVSGPETWRPESGAELVTEAWLTVGWGTIHRIDIEPASCGDPECTADHGFSGQMVSDDLTVRVSATGDGGAQVAQLVSFATALQQATGRS